MKWHLVVKLLKTLHHLFYMKEDRWSIRMGRASNLGKWQCNTTIYAHLGLSTVTSRFHCSLIILMHIETHNTQECTHTLLLYLPHADLHGVRTHSFAHIFWDQRKSWLQHFSPLQKSSQCQNDKWGIMSESVHTFIRLHKSFDASSVFRLHRRRLQAVLAAQTGPTCRLHVTAVISNVKLLST